VANPPPAPALFIFHLFILLPWLIFFTRTFYSTNRNEDHEKRLELWRTKRNAIRDGLCGFSFSISRNPIFFLSFIAIKQFSGGRKKGRKGKNNI
jgi:hypothetical protein